jgi:hypothetical protein
VRSARVRLTVAYVNDIVGLAIVRDDDSPAPLLDLDAHLSLKDTPNGILRVHVLLP